MKLAFDIGGTAIRRAIIKDREIIALDNFPTKGMELKSRLEALIGETVSARRIEFVGVSFAGQVTNGTILSAPNIDPARLKNISFPDWIKERFGLPAAIDNDLKCAALAEVSARECRNLFALFIGTGIGGAYIEDKKLLRGAKNLAGEIGHIPFEKAPFPCGCGKDNCLELSASGSAVARWGDLYLLNKNRLSDMLSADDDRSKEIVNRFMRGVTYAVETVAALLNPEIIILGGGVALNNPQVLRWAKNALKTAFRPAADIVIEQSSLGDPANLLGAAGLSQATP
ncbi:MAG: ROK family protein [Helicobacteraceae bacterium]|jgi:glucokinase|nr:ROK family protein [Helicobacteraceae bacterium]